MRCFLIGPLLNWHACAIRCLLNSMPCGLRMHVEAARQLPNTPREAGARPAAATRCCRLPASVRSPCCLLSVFNPRDLGRWSR